MCNQDVCTHGLFLQCESGCVGLNVQGDKRILGRQDIGMAALARPSGGTETAWVLRHLKEVWEAEVGSMERAIEDWSDQEQRLV